MPLVAMNGMRFSFILTNLTRAPFDKTKPEPPAAASAGMSSRKPQHSCALARYSSAFGVTFACPNSLLISDRFRSAANNEALKINQDVTFSRICNSIRLRLYKKNSKFGAAIRLLHFAL